MCSQFNHKLLVGVFAVVAGGCDDIGKATSADPTTTDTTANNQGALPAPQLPTTSFTYSDASSPLPFV